MTRSFQVLVIDDDPFDLQLAQLAFQQQPYPITLMTATSGGDALAQLQRGAMLTPDLILLDIHMPGLDGFDVLQVLKADGALQAIPVLMFSTSARPEDVQRASALRADGYLLKNSSVDVTAQQFFETLGHWCVGRHP